MCVEDKNADIQGLNGTENCYLADSDNSNKAKHKVQKQSENNNCKGAVRDVSV